MRKIVFNPYIDDDRKNLSPRAWLYLWNAVRAYPGGDREQTRVGNAVLQAIEALAERTESPNGDLEYRMRRAGGELLLEKPEHALLLAAWNKLRGDVPLAFSEQVLYVDSLLEHALEVSKEELVKALGKG